jgi:putative membrane protein
MKTTYEYSKKKPKNITSSDSGQDQSEAALHKTTQITTSYIFRAPKPHQTAGLLIVICMLFGFLINFDLKNIGSNFSYDSIIRNVLIFGILLLGLPALLSAVFSTPTAELLGGKFYLRRSVLLALISTVILILILLIVKFIDLFIELEMNVVLIFGYAALFGIRHPVLVATSNHDHFKSFPPSISQSIFGFLALCIIPNTFVQYSQLVLIYMASFITIFLAITILWLHIITRPFQRNFNVNGLLLMKLALTQFTEDKRSGLELENEFFSKIGISTNVRVGVIGFRNLEEQPGSGGSKKCNENDKKLKCLMVVPSVHPGPFGLLGGSNLPLKLFNKLRYITSNIMVFHGASTHEYNPVATSECNKISKAVSTLVKDMKYSCKAGTFNRARLEQSSQNISRVSLCAQRFGNGSIYIHTSAPESTDDIEYSVGEAIINHVQKNQDKKALFVDAHNCLEPGTGQVYFGSDKANDLVKLAGKIKKITIDSEHGEISIGFSARAGFEVKDGLGPMGIQTLVIQTLFPNGDDRTVAYILLDGNNIVPGLREDIMSTVSGIVDDAEVFTTDNHIVNTTMGGYNPVGFKFDGKHITKVVQDQVRKAKSKLEPCEVGMNSKIVKNIKILGPNTPLRLSATVNSTISVMKSSIIACQGLALAACWLIAIVL